MDREASSLFRSRAVARGIPMSPRKVRLLVDLVRGKPVTEALAMLKFMPQAAALPVAKVVKSAASNAEANYDLDPSTLRISRIFADEAKPLKRFRPRSRGHADRILKRASHITVVVTG